MKKTGVILIIALSIWACHKKTIPTSEIVISNKVEKEERKVSTPLPPKSDSSSTNMVVVGKMIYTTRCNRCHGLKVTENYTPQQWENILKSMIPRARLNEEESKQVTAFVMANAKK